MSKELTIWLLVFAVGAITYTARVSFIAFFARREMPPLLAHALRHVPAAMLTAIVVPAIVLAPAGTLAVTLGNHKLLAAIVADAAAWHWRSPLLTMCVGMGALWLAD